MLYDTLVAASRVHDSLDDVRWAALDRVRWLVDLLERRRSESGFDPSVWQGPDAYERWQAACAATSAEMDRRLAACADDDGRAAVLCLMLAARFDRRGFWQYDTEIKALARRVDGWTTDEVAVMLHRTAQYDMGFWFAASLGTTLDVAERLGADAHRALAPWLRRAHAKLMRTDVETRLRIGLAGRLRELLASVDEAWIPEGLVPPHAPWAAPLRDRAQTTPTAELAGLVRHLASLTGPRPTQRWRRTCLTLVDAASARDLVSGLLRALTEDDPRYGGGGNADTGGPEGGRPWNSVVRRGDADLARGVVWAAALSGGPEAVPGLAALALRAGLGPGLSEDLKLAGAAFNALAEVGDATALEALWQLQARIRHRALRKQVDTALVTAAARQGITAGQLVERSVPAHGLTPDGSVERELGGHRVRLAVEDATTVRLTFTAPGGRASRTAPAAVKEGFPDELRELKALAKEVRGTLAGERARLESLMSAEREWPYEEWCRHYRDHPVTGVVTRGLIWEFQDADGGWHAVAPGAEPPAGCGRVRLWHPIRARAGEVGAWRARIVADRLRQPFKQAFREIYLLTPAEEETGVYSNRFAAHIVHYRQLYALFKERGWPANFLGAHDGGHDGRARAEFGDGEWRACFYHEPAGDDYGYAPEHAATDQVRFERRDGRRWREARLSEVPPQVFSEAMRDVDLFVAVTSIAADPEWADRGEHRWTDYWRTAMFGELTASAEIRREALARILPRLRIADRCTLDGRYLVVRGDLTTYRIHLGSANILMAPDDTYLCVVPARRPTGGKVFLPFEDDRLFLILSKALMLAADTAITDQTVLAQIKRGG
ncbi:DUF4132 domain-containing protein [Streptomyces sp. NPDC096152]|uniref:DUF4132 domain-containing protein n=1 Tax=Streptomyces sp. NPDC096152 TaxID=3366078 RepID=UPI00381F911A